MQVKHAGSLFFTKKKRASKPLPIFKLFSILIIAACLHMPTSGFGQTVSINVKNASLKQVFHEIERQSDFTFVYGKEQIANLTTINLSVTNTKLETVLDMVFKGLDITYVISGKHIVVKQRKDIVDVPHSANTNALPVTVQGKVNDENGNPLSGVSVTIKGTSIGSTTDNAGAFSLKAKTNDTPILEFSFVGYNTQLVAYNGQTINIKLSESDKNPAQVVVVGYGTQKASDVTGSVTRANLEPFKNAPNSNLAQMLQGTVAGLNIGEVNSAGGAPSIQIRGNSTINGSTAVLIILDGIPYSGALASISPTDIASIDVLKDPSSKSIYGASAANGVILITTKKGKRGEKPLINFTSSYATQTPSNVLHPLTRDQFIQKNKDVNWKAAYLGPDYLTPNPAFILRNSIDVTQQAGYDDGTAYDWYGAATNPGSLSDNQLSISNATEKTSFFLSGGYTNQKGYVINDKFARKSIRLNIETKATNWLTIGAQLFGGFNNYGDGVAPDIRSAQLYSPLNVPFDAANNYVLAPNPSIPNPLLVTAINSFDHRNTLSGNFYATLDIPYISGLTYRIDYGNNYFWTEQYQANPYGAASTGSVSKYHTDNYDYTLDNILTYKKTIHKDHNLDVTMVYGVRGRNGQATTATGIGFANFALGYNGIQLAKTQTNTSTAWSEAYEYQLARLNYGFKGKYLLTSSIRRDGFSGFAANNKYGIFPSTALAWVVSKESFFKVKAIDNLKVRAGYGSNGNLTARYSSLATVSQSAAYVFGDAGTTLFGQQPSSLQNSNLKWESTTGYNLGLDFSILKNRITGSIDVFNTNTKNLLYSVPIPTLTGFSSILTNVGELKNEGVEVSLTGKIIQSNGFNWNMTVNYSKNSNTVMHLAGGDSNVVATGSGGLYIGRALGTIYSYKSDGLWQIGETPPSGYFVGGEKLVDVNNDGLINASDRTFLGKTSPDYRFSILNTFSYKQFSLSVFINSIQGGKNTYLGANDPWDAGIVGSVNAIRNNFLKEVDYWTPSNPNATFRSPGVLAPATYATPYNDRSFIRLQDVSLAYSLSKNLLDKIHVKSLQFFVSGKNLAIWTKWKGMDPETGQGLAFGGSPVILGFAGGLNLTF